MFSLKRTKNNTPTSVVTFAFERKRAAKKDAPQSASDLFCFLVFFIFRVFFHVFFCVFLFQLSFWFCVRSFFR